MRRNPEQLLQPPACDLLHHRRGRAADVEAGVLIPRRRQPVGGQRRRNRAADHEAEVPPARDRHDAGLRAHRELLDHLGGIAALVRQRPAEHAPQLVGLHLREHGSLFERLEEVRGELGGPPQELARILHATTLEERELHEHHDHDDRPDEADENAEPESPTFISPVVSGGSPDVSARSSCCCT